MSAVNLVNVAVSVPDPVPGETGVHALLHQQQGNTVTGSDGRPIPVHDGKPLPRDPTATKPLHELGPRLTTIATPDEGAVYCSEAGVTPPDLLSLSCRGCRLALSFSGGAGSPTPTRAPLLPLCGVFTSDSLRTIYLNGSPRSSSTPQRARAAAGPRRGLRRSRRRCSSARPAPSRRWAAPSCPSASGTRCSARRAPACASPIRSSRLRPGGLMPHYAHALIEDGPTRYAVGDQVPDDLPGFDDLVDQGAIADTVPVVEVAAGDGGVSQEEQA